MWDRVAVDPNHISQFLQFRQSSQSAFQNKVNRRDLITGSYPLDFVTQAITEVEKGNHIKAVIKPHLEEEI